MKLISWNVNGIRACVTKGFLDFFNEVDADIFCLQETKLQEGQIELDLPGYHQYWNYAEKKGYSGTAIFTKQEPISVNYGIQIEEHDKEGRVITLEFDNFYFVTVYTPNSQSELKRLDYRMKWEDDFRKYLLKLNSKKGVIVCGDLNVAHKEIDLKNPKTNKMVKRHVDFNQGLDANFLIEEKAALLSKLELNPVRIAFDHICQKEKYEKAIRTCFSAGLRSFSNYLLYNTNSASWKGQEYGADTPEDLYNRLKFNVELCEIFNSELQDCNINEKAYIYSFPMRYIPLNDMQRGYIGDNWNRKALRAIQVFITPTQGKGVTSKTFFEASFGKTIEEFNIALYTPENILVRRGEYKPLKKDIEDYQKLLEKKEKHNYNIKLLEEWNNILSQVMKENLWEHFVDNYVKDNVFSFDVYKNIENDLERKLFLYYLRNKYFCNYFDGLQKSDKAFINHFLHNDGVYLAQYFEEVAK